MTIHDELKYRQDTVESFLRIIDDLKRQIAKEERPRVGDTVECVEQESPRYGQIGTVVEDDRTYIPFVVKWPTGGSTWHRVRSLRLTYAATPKPRRWYNTDEFITFMFAHPVILVQDAEEFIRTGRPTASSSSTYISTAMYNIDDGNFTTFMYSTDGKTWQSFGVEG